MRNIEEIVAEIDPAVRARNFDELAALVTEVRALGTPKALASATWLEGRICALHGNNSQALALLERALIMEESIGDGLGATQVLANMGILFADLGDYPSALEHFERALALFKNHEVLKGVAAVSGNIAMIYREMGDSTRAFDFLEQAQSLHQQLGNKAGVAAVLSNMAGLYFDTADFEKALELYERALGLQKELDSQTGVPFVYLNIVNVLVRLKDFDRAREMLGELSEMPIDQAGLLATMHANRSHILVFEGDLEGAHRELTEALEIAERLEMRSLVATYHLELRDLAQKRNDFEGYVKHNTEHQRINEEIRGKEATQKMTMMAAERLIGAERQEREKERALLYGALPEHIATRMLAGESIDDHYDNACVLFADIAGFTTNSSTMHPSETIKLLEEVFTHFDAICEEHGVIKVKTIGDSYLCFAHSDIGDQISDIGPEQRIAAVALAMQKSEFYWPTSNEQRATSNRIQLRIGIHSGPVSAGVIGTQRLQYDVWGDTVNVASRMESTGEPGRVQVSSPFATALGNGYQISDIGQEEPTSDPRYPISDPRYPKLTERGTIDIKGKGTMTTYWLEGA